MPEERRNPPRRRIAGQRRRDTPESNPTTPETDQTVAPESDQAPDSGIDQTVAPESDATITTGTTGTTDPPVAAEGAESDDSGSAHVDAEPETSVGGRGRLVVGLLAVLVVLALTSAVLLGERALRGQRAEQARSEASTAARRAAELVLSYDYRSLTKDFEASRAVLTPEFAADFDQTTKVVAEQATKVKATVRAEVREVGVRDGDADRVTLLVFVNQTTTSTITQNKPRVDLNRARFTMVRIGGQWLVRSIEPL
ncbi:hypothetical protein [Kribbella deserti]|uniref:Mce-associated membrane protein n=1 Tax=Kribbella deserti TaxID=1926257 RepID=A0ABV6QVR0_9ACTN